MAPTKLLILTADDYGLHPSVNRAIRELFIHQHISQTSVLVNGPDIGVELEKLLQCASPSAIGLHFNLTEGLSLGKYYHTLTQSNGKFYPKQEFYWRWENQQIDLCEIEQECFLQIEALRKYVPEFTHFDSHNHVHLYPEIFQRIVSLFFNEQFKTIRIPLECTPENHYAQQAQHLIQSNVVFSFRCCPAFFGLSWVGRPNFPSLAPLHFFFKESPLLALEWMTHPGFYGSDKIENVIYGTPTLTPQARQLEFDFLSSPELAQFFQSYSFRFGTYFDWWQEQHNASNTAHFS